MFAQNVAEVHSIARALARRASRVTPADAAAAASRATADLARFPATFAESLGKALVPGGWMHDAVSVATVGFDFFQYHARARACARGGFRVHYTHAKTAAERGRLGDGVDSIKF